MIHPNYILFIFYNLSFFSVVKYALSLYGTFYVIYFYCDIVYIDVVLCLCGNILHYMIMESHTCPIFSTCFITNGYK